MGLRQTVMGLVDTGRISVPTFVEAMLGELSMETCDARLRWWSRKLIRDASVDLVVRGAEHAEGREPFIVMSNHQSLYDVPVLFCVLPGRLRMVAKEELFHVPIWGRAMQRAGFIRLDRRDRQKAVESLQGGAAMLADGTRVWIAPEGTRSPTGALGPFKSGGFHMAEQASARILPVAIDGTRRVLPARGTIVQTGMRVVVTILPPIDPRAYGPARRRALMDDVRRAIASALPS